MKRNTTRKRRKSPIQSRSKETVDVIIKATAQVLVEQGYQGTTTNKIAEKAGVSIGSFYEYFPNKDSAISALIESHSEEVMRIMLASITENVRKPLKEAMCAWLRTMVQAIGERADFTRVVIRQVPFLGEVKTVVTLQNRLDEIAVNRAGLVGGMKKVKNPEATVFLLTTMVGAAVMRIALDRPDRLDEEELVDELTEILVRYLETPE